MKATILIKILVLLSSMSVQASYPICQLIDDTRDYAVADLLRVGRPLIIKFKDGNETSGFFLGGSHEGISGVMTKVGEVYYFKNNDVEIFDKSGKKITQNSREMFSIKVQNGTTCLPNAAFNCLKLFFLRGMIKNPELLKNIDLGGTAETQIGELKPGFFRRVFLNLKDLILKAITGTMRFTQVEAQTHQTLRFFEEKGFTVTATSDEGALRQHIEKGGAAILNVYVLSISKEREVIDPSGQVRFMGGNVKHPMSISFGYALSLMNGNRNSPHSMLVVGVGNGAYLIADSATGRFHVWSQKIIAESIKKTTAKVMPDANSPVLINNATYESFAIALLVKP